MIYLIIFLTFLKIGFLNFGGGNAMISFVQNEVVYHHAWLTDAQFTDMIAISQMTPGPIGINMATYAGYIASGDIYGSLIATIAVCIPSLILMTLAVKYLAKHSQDLFIKSIFAYIRPLVVGLILAVVLTMMSNQNFLNFKSIFIFTISLFLGLKIKLSPVKIILLGAVLGYVL